MAGAGEFPKDDTVPKTDIVYALDFNTIRTAVLAIIGVGSETSGYGATEAADLNNVAVSPTDVILASSWDTLATAINRCRRHQAASPTLIATRPVPITAAWVNSVKTIADAAVTNKDLVVSTELVAVTGVTSSVSTTTSWNGTLYKTVRVPFATQNAMRNFFNAGGYISVTHAPVTGNSGSKENNWKAAIDGLGELRYGLTQFRQSGQVTIGSNNVTNYSGSSVYVRGSRNLSGSAYVDIVLYYDDGNSASGLPISSDPTQTGRIDELLTLNISSTVGYASSAGQITSPTPNAVNTWTDSGYSATQATPPDPGGGGGGAFAEVGNQVYNSAGTFTFTQPAGSTAVKVAIYGAGGGGGNGQWFQPVLDRYAVGGGGGGGGGYIVAGFQLAAGQTLNITVGAKGLGSTGTGAGGTGGLSRVTATGVTVTANGGGGGGTSTGILNPTPAGGTGGTTSQSGATTVAAFNGAAASGTVMTTSNSTSSTSCNGAAGATGGAGNPGAGAGGTATFNGTSWSAANGGNAIGIGGNGGGGGAAFSSPIGGNGVTNGGNGTDGRVVIYYGNGTTF